MQDFFFFMDTHNQHCTLELFIRTFFISAFHSASKASLLCCPSPPWACLIPPCPIQGHLLWDRRGEGKGMLKKTPQYLPWFPLLSSFSQTWLFLPWWDLGSRLPQRCLLSRRLVGYDRAVSASCHLGRHHESPSYIFT